MFCCRHQSGINNNKLLYFLLSACTLHHNPDLGGVTIETLQIYSLTHILFFFVLDVQSIIQCKTAATAKVDGMHLLLMRIKLLISTRKKLKTEPSHTFQHPSRAAGLDKLMPLGSRSFLNTPQHYWKKTSSSPEKMNQKPVRPSKTAQYRFPFHTIHWNKTWQHRAEETPTRAQGKEEEQEHLRAAFITF